jgi:hypothetical protein
LTSLGMVTPIIATIKNIIEDKEKIIWSLTPILINNNLLTKL